MALNKILTSANLRLAVTNLFGAEKLLPHDQISGIPLGTSTGGPTGEIGVKVLIVGNVAGAGGLTNTELRATPIPVTGVTISSATSTGVTATVASSTLLAANSARLYAVLVNAGAVDVFLRLGTPAAINSGIYLRANGGAYEINSTNLYKGIITVITASSTSIVTVTEGI